MRMLLVVPLLIVAIVAAGWWYVFVRAEHNIEPGQAVQLEIPKGSSTAEIGQLLSKWGVVPNGNRFRLEARREAADGKLRAGVYDLVTGMPYDAVIDRLVAGPPVKYMTITIPEGFTIDQVAARVAKTLGVPEAEVLDLVKTGASSFGRPYLKRAYRGSLEGYLFPKTYRVREGASARDAIDMMLGQFEKETSGLDLSYPDSRGLDLHDVVTIASMVEREASVAKERPLVSSVIYNRLKKGMRLEIDATIEYVLPGNRFRLQNRHLEIDSPYNTYRNAGLPPGPIANPGLAALRAAADPAETSYIYYVLTAKDGSHTFARTWDEFLAAKAKSKKVFGR